MLFRSQYMSYATNKDDFDSQCQMIKEKLEYYDRLFDKYSSYDDINNVKTINDNAGIKAVKVALSLRSILKRVRMIGGVELVIC